MLTHPSTYGDQFDHLCGAGSDPLAVLIRTTELWAVRFMRRSGRIKKNFQWPSDMMNSLTIAYPKDITKSQWWQPLWQRIRKWFKIDLEAGSKCKISPRLRLQLLDFNKLQPHLCRTNTWTFLKGKPTTLNQIVYSQMNSTFVRVYLTPKFNIACVTFFKCKAVSKSHLNFAVCWLQEATWRGKIPLREKLQKEKEKDTIETFVRLELVYCKSIKTRATSTSRSSQKLPRFGPRRNTAGNNSNLTPSKRAENATSLDWKASISTSSAPRQLLMFCRRRWRSMSHDWWDFRQACGKFVEKQVEKSFTIYEKYWTMKICATRIWRHVIDLGPESCLIH